MTQVPTSLAIACLSLAACAHHPSTPARVTVEDLIGDPDLARYVATRGGRLGQPASAQVTPDGQRVLYLESGARSDVRVLHVLRVSDGVDHVLATAESLLGVATADFSKEEAAQRERMRVTARGLPSFELSEDGRLVLVPLGGKLYILPLDGGAPRPLPSAGGGAFDPRLSPDGTKVAFVRNQEVWVQAVSGGPEHQLTRGAGAGISHGMAEFVAQEEMDRFHGFFWSPDSQWLAFEEADERGVEPFYLADPTKGDAPAEASPYPRPGHPNASVRLGVISAQGGTPLWIAWNREALPYLARVDWPLGGPLLLQVESRDQRTLQLLQANPVTGATAVLWTEHDAAWVELHDDLRWLPGIGFLWSSERDGQRNLELHAGEGMLLRTLTPDTLGFRSLVEVDLATRMALVMASTDSTRAALVAVPLDGSAAHTALAGDGMVSAHAAKDGRFLVVREEHPSAMPDHSVRRSDGSLLCRLPSAAEAPPQLPQVRFTTVTLPQGTLEVALVLPRRARPGQRFPVIDWVYGGPTVVTVQRSALQFELQQWLADQGFAVVKIDNRGTPDRGRAFSRAIVGDFADVPLTDQADALAALAAQEPALDLGRVGILGASFGGYLSALAVLRRPDRFQAAVALAPVTDWLDYDTHYTERYLGLPQDNPGGYARSSLISDAKELRRPLLLAHGMADDNVHLGHTLKLIAALEANGHAPAVFLIPGQTHLFADQTTQQVLWAAAAAFLIDKLKP